MNFYRISKYNPKFRDKFGAFTIREWTSISDVGRIYGGKTFTMQDYFQTENQYINCFLELLNLAHCGTLKVHSLECQNSEWHEGEILSIPGIELFARQCLREQIWGKLESECFFIHFGYDYYTYIGTILSTEEVAEACKANFLYSEERPSPYSE